MNNISWKTWVILGLVILVSFVGGGLILSKLEEKRLAKYMEEMAKAQQPETA